ncbi:patatin-like phospholipase family protein [uncultured Cellulomonas sp.]|uniref:patatin-like phospholipase family protein n=1 Tax=uncultured Cellulomonas sp. TaxID=189682 RepID=UPI002614D26A|nr:patatin-like phospholipase family protein [uncultured Cellulomonas sp.]
MRAVGVLRRQLRAAGRRTGPTRVREALALSGGGSRAGFEIGALRYLYDVVGVSPSIITGTSAGSLVAAVLAQSRDPHEQRAALAGLETLWRGMRTSSDLFEETPWFTSLRTIAPEWLEVFQRRRRVGHVLGDPAEAPMWSPFRTVDALLAMRALGRTGRDLEHVLSAAETAQGLFAPGRLTRQVQDPAVFDPGRVPGSGVQLRIAVVGLESGELRYVTEAGRLVDRSNRPVPGGATIAITDAVRASSAIPVVFPPVRLDGEHYVDGGVREVVPIEMAARHLGGTRCWAVVASATGSPPDTDFAGKNILAIASRAYTDIMWDEVLRDEVELARTSARVTLIQPEVDVHDSLGVDPGLTAIDIDHGWLRAGDVVRGADADECRLTARIVTLRRDIWQAEHAHAGVPIVRGAGGGPGGGTGGGTGAAAVSDAPTAHRRPTAADDAALALLKRQLRDAVAAKDPAQLPAGAHGWWQRWEDHAWPTPVRRPWPAD